MAAADEVLPLPKPPSCVPGKICQISACTAVGEPDARYFDAIVRFARAHFASDGRVVRVHRAGPGQLPPLRRDGIDIVVDARSSVGWLEVSSTAGRWDGGDNFCVHVIHGPRTTLVVKFAGGWIK